MKNHSEKSCKDTTLWDTFSPEQLYPLDWNFTLNDGTVLSIDELQGKMIEQTVVTNGVYYFKNTWSTRRRWEDISAEFFPFYSTVDLWEYVAKIIRHWPYPLAYDTRKKYFEYAVYLFDKNEQFQNGYVPNDPLVIINNWWIWSNNLLKGRHYYEHAEKVDSTFVDYKQARSKLKIFSWKFWHRVYISQYGESILTKSQEATSRLTSYFNEEFWVSEEFESPSKIDEKKKRFSLWVPNAIRLKINRLLDKWTNYIEVDTIGAFSIRIENTDPCFLINDIHIHGWGIAYGCGAIRILFDSDTGKPATLKIRWNPLPGPIILKWNSDNRMIIRTTKDEEYYFDTNWNHITLRDPYWIEVSEYSGLSFSHDAFPWISPSQHGTPLIRDWKNINRSWQNGEYIINPNDTVWERLN